MNECVIRRMIFLVAFALALVAGREVFAAVGPLPLADVEVPEALKGWELWALHGTQTRRCPQNENANAICEWISELSVSADDHGATFSMRVDAFSDVRTILPRAKGAWPISVLVDQKPVPVAATTFDEPSVLLTPGTHRIEGTLRWNQLPPSLAIPQIAGVVSVKLRGQELAFVEVDDSGAISLLAQGKASQNEDDGSDDASTIQKRVNELELSVHRKFSDAIPAILETRLNVSIGGAQREEILGPVLPEGFLPVSVSSDTLSVRMDEKGRLKIVAKPGRHTIDVKSRLEDGRKTQFAMPVSESAWVDEETWSFVPNDALRQVTISGVESLDPKRTPMPEEWHRLVAYRLSPGDTLNLKETSRGMAPENQSGIKPTIDRTLWLDFDGKSFSVLDRIQGRTKRSQRLNAQSPLQLGRIYQQKDNNLLITHSPVDQLPGVELPAGSVDLTAESRMARSDDQMAWGWTQEFQSARLSLILPPGWRLFSASSDLSETFSNSSWLASWNLWSLFLLMLAAAVAGQFYGWKWGAFVLVAMALLIPEQIECAYLGILLIGLNALWKFMHKTRLKKFIGLLRWAGRIAFAGIGLSILIHQLSVGIHPILERSTITSFVPSTFMGDYREGAVGAMMNSAMMVDEDEGAPMEDVSFMAAESAPRGEKEKALPSKAYSSKPKAKVARRASSSVQSAYRLDASAAAQLGWGTPSWMGNRHRFSLNEHIPTGATVSFKLIPPWLHRTFCLLRALLILLVMGLFFEIQALFFPRAKGPKPTEGASGEDNSQSANGSTDASTASPVSPSAKAVAVAILSLGMSALSLAQPVTAFAEDTSAMPSEAQLTTLRERLLAKPDCFPRCVSIPSMAIVADEESATLSVDAEIHALAPSVVNLPGLDNLAYPATASLKKSGSSEVIIRRISGGFSVFVPQGIHHVTLKGALPSSRDFHLPIPVAPKSISVQAKGFDVTGIDSSGMLSGASLVFVRQESSSAASDVIGTEAASADATEESGDLTDDNTWKKSRSAYFSVQRRFVLGMTWQVFTHVWIKDVGTTSEAISIPLIPGEKILDEGLNVEGNQVRIALSHANPEISWVSSLENTPSIELKAPQSGAIFEKWAVEADPIWHLQFSGSAPVLSMTSAAQRGQSAEFQPLPGESVTIQVQRPKPLDGQRTVVESSQLTVTPGQRDTKASLELKVSSSVGIDFPIQLPQDVTLTKVMMGSRELELPLSSDGKVIPHFAPGTNKLMVEWLVEGRPNVLWKLPEVKLPMASANATTTMSPSASQWVLLAGGAPMGPVVRFWSLLLAMILVSFVLAKISKSQPVFLDWLFFFVGLSIMESSIPTMIVGAGWFLFIGWRARTPNLKPWAFNLRQIFVVISLIVFLVMLIVVASEGVLSSPDMKIEGYRSTCDRLQWFVDRTNGTLAGPWVISVPIMAYKVTILAWALWLAFALVRWIKWAFGAFSVGGMWKVTSGESEQKSESSEPEKKSSAPDQKAEEVVTETRLVQKPDQAEK